MFSNNYDPFDGFFGPSYFGTPFSSPHEQRRRQELARRQQLEAERRRKLELERRRLMQLEREKEERRRELEMMRRQQMMKEEQMRRKKLAQQRRSRYSPGTVVLGPDGNLYRVMSPTEGDDERLHRGEERTANRTENNRPPVVPKKRFSVSDESKENSDDQMIPSEDKRSSDEETESSSELDDCSMDDVCASHTHEDHFYDAYDTLPNPAAHTEEVEVEDVPDDEDDELRELHSIWRNRSPSPGQWMEPIE